MATTKENLKEAFAGEARQIKSTALLQRRQRKKDFRISLNYLLQPQKLKEFTQKDISVHLMELTLRLKI